MIVGKKVESSCSSSGSMAMNMNGCGSGVTGVQVQQNGEDGRVSVSSLLNEEVYLELESKAVSDTKALAVELCRHFYSLGWLSGTGGSFTLRVHHYHDAVSTPSHLIVMSPSGVQKERMVPEDMYVLSSDGFVLTTPVLKSCTHAAPKCTDCAPLFMKVYEMCNAGAVIHSHGMESCLITMINPFSKEFRITHMEMIKGICGHGYHEELVVPIIENSAHEGELLESLTEAIRAYPKTTAVLVRNHGVFIWGDSWVSAKTQAECYHYLFDAAIKLHQLGLDWSTPSHGPIRNVSGFWGCSGNFSRALRTGALSLDDMIEPSQHCVLLDIEGTTTPASFVSDVLFPYAHDNVGKHLAATYDSEEAQNDINLLRSQVQIDLEQGVIGAVPIPLDYVGKELVIASLVANVTAMIRADRKVTSLKQLQGHIWRTGFQSNEFVAIVFDDVAKALARWHASGTKVYIYSSVIREAQQLLLANSNYGDLKKYLCGFFDTTVGKKKETRSYVEILKTVGIDRPADMLFVTDDFREAVAAAAAGLEVILSLRPGNEPLPENHGFRAIESLLEIQH
ncbi:putative bifunctional methylthioribulose-1-phosphate dehydratase/enolase-phosphatase e1 2 [Quercus suber]|uniref:Probable bifunctional methylthioribulose-1-phosphate dehydratase/enolase-phosphatase E1 n=1 Tax=Quercus suber TaxID=58331 RepID=A0AAW0L0E8_QUESU|nr:putative bifunctional methylthioribulose-1-phosphate dehydratase/enolase-phosphatase e1 2 [Quercus suber]